MTQRRRKHTVRASELQRVHLTRQDDPMRTTIDLPDNLYRTLEARASLCGSTLAELIQHFIEQGLRAPIETIANQKNYPVSPPPVIIPADGVPIPALSAAELRRIEEEEDEAKYGRST